MGDRCVVPSVLTACTRRLHAWLSKMGTWVLFSFGGGRRDRVQHVGGRVDVEHTHAFEFCDSSSVN